MAELPYDRRRAVRSAFQAWLVGLVLLFIIYIWQLLVEREVFSLEVVLRFHRTYPFFYVLDVLPFMLGGLVWHYTQRHAKQVAEEAAYRHQNETRTLHQVSLVMAMQKGQEYPYEADKKGDDLGIALVELQRRLNRSREEEAKRREEDTRRNWLAEGQAKFSELLREDTDNLPEMAYSVISNLVKYVEANQCGFYLIEGKGSDRHFDLIACYAYDRRKFANRRIEWGDGLIGSCALEGVTTHLDRVPQGYISITSGLGDATPQNLLLVPVKQEETIFGVLEMASFKPFAPHVVEFVERVATSIASTLSSKQINLRTAELLADTQKQAQVLSEQEEQMRQNMEELQATQEDAARQNESFISFTNSVNRTLIRAEYDTQGILLYANDKFLSKLDYARQSEVKGMHISLFIHPKDRDSFSNTWTELVQQGVPFEGDMKHVTRTGKDLWTIATYTLLQEQQGNTPGRVLFLAIDITRDKKQNLDWQGQMEALNRMSLKAELSPLGDLMDANSLFLDTLGYTRADVLQHPFYDLFPRNEQAGIERIIEGVCRGESFKGTFRILSKSGEEHWLRATIATVNDMYGDISKVILIANDITREKQMEFESKKQTDMLKAQEEQLRLNEVQLSRKLREAREEVKNQFKEIEKVQIRTEKTLEGFLDAIVTTDQDGVVEFFNKAAEELFGVERGDVLGQNIRLLFPGEVMDLQSDDFLSRYLDPKAEKIVGERREVQIRDSSGEDKSVLMLLSEARVGRKVNYTAFVQQISVDLF